MRQQLPASQRTNVPAAARAVWWVKRDARLADNAALTHALSTSCQVLPLFVFEPLVLAGPDWSNFHTDCVYQTIRALRKNLQHFGSDLIVRYGAIEAELDALYATLPFATLVSHQETGLNHTYARDRSVARWCAQRGISWVEVPTNGVRRGGNDRATWAAHFQQVMDAPVLPVPAVRLVTSFPPRVLTGRMPSLTQLGVSVAHPVLQGVSERLAHQTLHDFLQHRAVGYAGGISSMCSAPTACSRLSVHLAWGTLSLRQALQATNARRENLVAGARSTQWRRSLRNVSSRLYWHAHFVQKLEDEVALEFQPANPIFATGLPTVRGRGLTHRLEAWQQGQTGFPYVDAAMRYYRHHGWLNFRARAMVTSFAVHALRLPWQRIQYELAKYMFDYVPGINTTQVQMQAGVTGTNTIRVYSPLKQMLDHDPEAQFVRAYVPELRGCTADDIAQFQTKRLGAYPPPIIDFKRETTIMKDALYSRKQSPAGRAAARVVYRRHGSRRRQPGR